MPDLGADPAEGSPEGVGEIARTFRAYAEAAERHDASARSAQTVLAGTGSDAVDATRADIAVLGTKFGSSQAASESVARILERYADGLADLRRRAEAAHDDAEQAWMVLQHRRSAALSGGMDGLVGWALAWDEVMPAWLYPGDPVRLQHWQQAIEEFERARDAYRRLAAERAELDHRTRDRLLAVPLFAELTGRWRLGGGGAVTAADAWAGDTSAITPEGLAAVEDPALVRRVWDALSSDQQHALIAAGPVALGSLAGLPPWARVAANQLNAKGRAAEVREVLARHPHPYNRLRDEEVDKLRAELDYLEQAVAGRVQLYLYDHTTDSIIEMIGQLGPATTEINTYVPGTYTSATSVYRGEVQQVGRWLNENSGGSIVTFVWKVGRFPGENEHNGGMSPLRVLEANDSTFAMEKGHEIAAFERELDVATGHVPADRNGIGHSWGLTGLTSAEVAGAHYDSVVSLAGAGMVEEWTPDPTTDYQHLSYRDVLMLAQSTGAVWAGRNPGTSPDFAARILPDEGDFAFDFTPPSVGYAMYTDPLPPIEIEVNSNFIDAHSRIATDQRSNWDALRRMWEGLTQ